MSNSNNNDKDVVVGPFAKIGALVATFFLLPLFHGATIQWIESFTAEHYGYVYISYANISWFVIGGFFVFAAAQLLISLALKFILNIPKLLTFLFFIGRS